LSGGSLDWCSCDGEVNVGQDLVPKIETGYLARSINGDCGVVVLEYIRIFELGNPSKVSNFYVHVVITGCHRLQVGAVKICGEGVSMNFVAILEADDHPWQSWFIGILLAAAIEVVVDHSSDRTSTFRHGVHVVGLLCRGGAERSGEACGDGVGAYLAERDLGLQADLRRWAGKAELGFGGHAIVPGHRTNRLGQNFKRAIRIVAGHGDGAVGSHQIVRATNDLSGGVLDGDIERFEFGTYGKINVPYLNLLPR
jgi:hypothetical protein